MHLSDELHKYDAYIENSTRKIANQLFDVLETGEKKEKSDLPTNPYDNLTVNNSMHASLSPHPVHITLYTPISQTQLLRLS